MSGTRVGTYTVAHADDDRILSLGLRLSRFLLRNEFHAPSSSFASPMGVSAKGFEAYEWMRCNKETNQETKSHKLLRVVRILMIPHTGVNQHDFISRLRSGRRERGRS